MSTAETNDAARQSTAEKIVENSSNILLDDDDEPAPQQNSKLVTANGITLLKSAFGSVNTAPSSFASIASPLFAPPTFALTGPAQDLEMRESVKEELKDVEKTSDEQMEEDKEEKEPEEETLNTETKKCSFLLGGKFAALYSSDIQKYPLCLSEKSEGTYLIAIKNKKNLKFTYINLVYVDYAIEVVNGSSVVKILYIFEVQTTTICLYFGSCLELLEYLYSARSSTSKEYNSREIPIVNTEEEAQKLILLCKVDEANELLCQPKQMYQVTTDLCNIAKLVPHSIRCLRSFRFKYDEEFYYSRCLNHYGEKCDKHDESYHWWDHVSAGEGPYTKFKYSEEKRIELRYKYLKKLAEEIKKEKEQELKKEMVEIFSRPESWSMFTTVIKNNPDFMQKFSAAGCCCCSTKLDDMSKQLKQVQDLVSSLVNPKKRQAEDQCPEESDNQVFKKPTTPAKSVEKSQKAEVVEEKPVKKAVAKTSAPKKLSHAELDEAMKIVLKEELISAIQASENGRVKRANVKNPEEGFFRQFMEVLIEKVPQHDWVKKYRNKPKGPNTFDTIVEELGFVKSEESGSYYFSFGKELKREIEADE